jgi:hypothetical protein
MSKDEIFKASARGSELHIALGQHAVIVLKDKDGNDLDMAVEVRTTVEGRCQVFVHTPELCRGPRGCQPVVSMRLDQEDRPIRPKPEPEVEDLNFLAGLAEIFGGDQVFVIDEKGMRPLKPKKGN